MFLIGSLVNGLAIAAGGLIGVLGGKFLPERMKDTLLHATALMSIGVAIPGLVKTGNALIPILSLLIGAIVGELLNIDGFVNRLGDKLQSVFKGRGRITEGFVTGSLVFAVGAMAVMGALDSGLKNDHAVLYAKSVIDGVASIVFATGMGVGVMFSGLSVFLVEGLIAALATLVAPFLSAAVLTEVTFTGSLLILAISFNVLGITKIKVLNLVPALICPIFLCMFL